jgi:hypothetical protein
MSVRLEAFLIFAYDLQTGNGQYFGVVRKAVKHETSKNTGSVNF